MKRFGIAATALLAGVSAVTDPRCKESPLEAVEVFTDENCETKSRLPERSILRELEKLNGYLNTFIFDNNGCNNIPYDKKFSDKQTDNVEVECEPDAIKLKRMSKTIPCNKEKEWGDRIDDLEYIGLMTLYPFDKCVKLDSRDYYVKFYGEGFPPPWNLDGGKDKGKPEKPRGEDTLDIKYGRCDRDPCTGKQKCC